MSFYSKLDKNILFPIAEKIQNSAILKHYRFLKSTEWWNRSQIEKYRDEKLNLLLIHAYKNVPYYNELFDRLDLKPQDIENYDDLEKIPILTKQIIRDNFDKMQSKDSDRRNLKLHSTGGSTGVPLQFKTDMNCWSSRWASTFRAWDIYGFNVGEKIFTIGGHSLVSKKKRIKKQDIWEKVLMRNYKFSSSGMKDSDMLYYYNKFVKIKPKAIRGYGSSLYIFAKYIEKNKLEIPSISLILTTGEVLLPNYRAKLQEVFKAPVYDNYGAGDGGIHSHECLMHKGLHISEEDCIIEICDNDGIRLENGETGNVITTDLHNYAFPFIRYQVGDMAYIKPDFCSCGRKTKLIGEVMGRAGKLLYNKNGTPISPTMLPFMLYPNMDYNKKDNIQIHNKISKYKFIQDHKGDLFIKIELKNEFRKHENKYFYIHDNVKKYFPGSDINISFCEVGDNLLSSGKENYVESNFKKEIL